TGLALVFALHPTSALVAAWIPCRNESLLAIACIASTLALVAYLRGGRPLALVGCVAAYAAALFAKESGGALLAPLACVVALERRIYLPLVGLLLFASQLPLLERMRAPAWLGGAVAFAVALGFGVVTAQRLPQFSNAIRYWESAARQSPHSAFAASRLAWRYY